MLADRSRSRSRARGTPAILGTKIWMGCVGRLGGLGHVDGRRGGAVCDHAARGMLALDITRIEAGSAPARRGLHRRPRRAMDRGAEVHAPRALPRAGAIVVRQAELLQRPPGHSERRGGARARAWKFVGLEVDWAVARGDLYASHRPRRRSLPTHGRPRAACPMLHDGQRGETGRATRRASCWSPILKRYIALAHLADGRTSPRPTHRGSSLEVTVEHQRRQEAVQARRATACPSSNPERKRAVTGVGIATTPSSSARATTAWSNARLPRACRQEGRGPRASPPRRRRGRDRGRSFRASPLLPCFRTWCQPAAAGDHPRPRPAAPRPRDPAAR